jgi:hypothetical protein
MAIEQAMIKIRIDVDYPYESRALSVLSVALRSKNKRGHRYLRNACIIARMINESPKEVKAYWFFTPYTIPNKELLELLDPERHEVALHVATNPVKEWKKLEEETGRSVKYYTIHGTQRKFARLLWGRKLSQAQAVIPTGFPLESFHVFKTFSLDRVRFQEGSDKTLSEALKWSENDIVLSIHPDWLFAAGGGRGPYYDVLYRLLEVDDDLCSLSVKKKGLLKIGHDTYEYEKNISPTAGFIKKLQDRNVDVYTFLDRRWCCPIDSVAPNWVAEDDNVGLLEIKDYNSWLQLVGKKTRNMIRKAEKAGVKIAVVEPSDKLAEGISKIYNETPIRQERAFTHYGEPIEVVRGNMYAAKNNTFIGAYLGEELVGFIQLLYGDNIAIVSNILSLQQHWDKALNNALLAKAVEVCAEKKQRWLMYGRIGNHPSLDRFKDNNGFVKFPIKRIYIPLSRKGRLAVKLGLHKDAKDALPEALKGFFIPLANWVSRTKIKVKMRLKRMR